MWFYIQSIVIRYLGWSVWRRFSLTEIHSWKRDRCFNSLCRELLIDIRDVLPNFTGCSSLKLQYRSPTTNFLYPVTWTSMGPSCTLDVTLTHIRLCKSTLWSLGNIGSLAYFRFYKCGHITLYNIKKIMFRKSLRYGMLLSIEVDTCFPKF